MRRFLALSSAIALTVMMSSFTYAQEEMDVDSFPQITIDFSGSGDTGDLLDGASISSVTFDTPLGPFNVPEDERTGEDQLTIAVVGATGFGAFSFDNTLGFISQGLGINSGAGAPTADNPTNFDSGLNESVTFAFNQDLFITAIDLNNSLIGVGSAPEFFEVGGIEIDGNNPGDIFSFINADSPDGLFVAAGDGVLFLPTAGSANIDTLTVQIATPPEVPEPSPAPEPSAAVPEPSTAVLLVSLGMIGVARRRRK